MMEFNSEPFKNLVDEIHGLREDIEEVEAALWHIIESDEQDPQDWLEVYLRDKTTACVMLACKRDHIMKLVLDDAKKLVEMLKNYDYEKK